MSEMVRMEVDDEGDGFVVTRSYYNEFRNNIDEFKLDKFFEEHEKLKSEKTDLERLNKMLQLEIFDKNEKFGELNIKYSDNEDILKEINTKFEELQREKKRLMVEKDEEVRRLIDDEMQLRKSLERQNYTEIQKLICTLKEKDDKIENLKKKNKSLNDENSEWQNLVGKATTF